MSVDRAFYTAVGLLLVGILGFGVTVVLQAVSTSQTRTLLAFWLWVVFVISLTSLVVAFVLALVVRARLRRDITGR